MKKTYKNPKLTVVKIQPVRILAGSPNPVFNPSGTTSTMDARGSRFSDDDFDFDEE